LTLHCKSIDIIPQFTKLSSCKGGEGASERHEKSTLTMH